MERPGITPSVVWHYRPDTYFGYPYLKDNGASLGVPIVKELSTIDSKPARNTVAECYTEIISDMDGRVILDGVPDNAYWWYLTLAM